MKTRSLLLVVILFCSSKAHPQSTTTAYPFVSSTNCNICRITKVVVDDNYTSVLLEVNAQSKGSPWVSFSRWTALLPYESPAQVASLRKLDLDIPEPRHADPQYLASWRELAGQIKAMRDDVSAGGKLILAVDNYELDTKYNIKSKDPNQKFQFWLRFNKIPIGVEELLIIELTTDGWEFARIKVKNPDTSPTTTWTEESIKTHWTKNGIKFIEGIYEKASSDEFSPKYRVAVKKNSVDNDYSLIYLSGAESRLWKVGDIKAKLLLTASQNLYKTIWYMGDKSINEDVYTSFDEGLMKLSWTDKRPDEIYVKLYPTTTSEYSSSSKLTSSGTGFALSENGYIVTNYHVIQGSNKVNVRGVKGNFSKTYEAKVIIEDKNNDIAIIKIDDAEFTSLGTPPYNISAGIADVGISVYALGYPLRASMGDEVKLTNGIISSKTGYQGDITAYQVSVPVQPGNSGGPLLDSKGNVIGLVNAKHTGAENVSYAIKTTYLMNLIQAMTESPILPVNNTISNKELSEQVKFVREFIYIIEPN